MNRIIRIIDVISLIVWIILGICMVIYKNISVFTIATLWIVNFINLCSMFVKDFDEETGNIKEKIKHDK